MLPVYATVVFRRWREGLLSIVQVLADISFNKKSFHNTSLQALNLKDTQCVLMFSNMLDFFRRLMYNLRFIMTGAVANTALRTSSVQ